MAAAREEGAEVAGGWGATAGVEGVEGGAGAKAAAVGTLCGTCPPSSRPRPECYHR